MIHFHQGIYIPSMQDLEYADSIPCKKKKKKKKNVCPRYDT